MVEVWVTHLSVQCLGGLAIANVGFEEIVRSPCDRIQNLIQLTAGLLGIVIFNDAPAQHGNTRSHGETKFHMVASVVIAARKVEAHIGAIAQSRISAPGNPLICG